MKSLSTSISVFVMVGFSGKSVQNELLLNFVSDKCEILILATQNTNTRQFNHFNK